MPLSLLSISVSAFGLEKKTLYFCYSLSVFVSLQNNVFILSYLANPYAVILLYIAGFHSIKKN